MKDKKAEKPFLYRIVYYRKFLSGEEPVRCTDFRPTNASANCLAKRLRKRVDVTRVMVSEVVV